MEMLAFALITASRKLRHYFQAHVINVPTYHPLKKAMNKLEAAGRLIQWAMELSEFDVRYQPRSAVKSQALVDFIVEFTPSRDELDKDEGDERGIGVILKSPEGDKLEYAAHLQYQTTNNEVEYEALLKGLELAKSLGVESIIIKRDSQLIINYVNGLCDAKEDRMKKYLSKVRRLVQNFMDVSFIQLPKEESMEADALAKATLGGEVLDAYDKIQYMPSIDLPDVPNRRGRKLDESNSNLS
ncbi:uncharacterized protein LOC142605993 [Castanea sativa]|uniref:uncharacterized protein LOC142605993 n=1 Tax=Castanea sativa TaxID=21020 RepID=UPI003F6520BE